MGVSADLKLVQQAIEECFAKQFQKRIALKEIALGPKSHLDFTVHLAPLDEAMREDLFVQVEESLSHLLQKRFGYTKSFHLIVRI